MAAWPGIGQLVQSLKNSKDAIEQCIGSQIISFVPPFDQPFDYPARWAFSLSERRSVSSDRTDLHKLFETLGECGYQFSRVAYQPIYRLLLERMLGDHTPTCSKLERMEGYSWPG